MSENVGVARVLRADCVIGDVRLGADKSRELQLRHRDLTRLQLRLARFRGRKRTHTRAQCGNYRYQGVGVQLHYLHHRGLPADNCRVNMYTIDQ